MKQNEYDDPTFFAQYSQMARSIGGLEAAGEWPAFCALLPDLSEKHVLDLGCGFGWHCRYAREQRAHSVLGGRPLREEACAGESEYQLRGH